MQDMGRESTALPLALHLLLTFQSLTSEGKHIASPICFTLESIKLKHFVDISQDIPAHIFK